MKWIKLFFDKLWMFVLINKDLVILKMKLNLLDAEESDLAKKCLTAGLSVDEIAQILSTRRVKKELVNLLKAAGYTDLQIEDILKKHSKVILSGASASEIFNEIKSNHTPK